MTSITNPNAIKALQLRTALRAIRLEERGMTRRGRSVTAMYREHYGMKPRAPRSEVVAAIQNDLQELEASLHG